MDQPADGRNVKLLVEYDGTDFAGWQAQSEARTVQVTIEDAIHAVTGARVRITGSGRTDAGVHALGQVANVRLSTRIPAERLADALNANLPPDVAIVRADDVPWAFHARFDARAKTYRYDVCRRGARPALGRRTVHHLRSRLCPERMRAAARMLEGRHDFRSFATVDPSRRGASAVRTLFSADVDVRDDRVRMTFTADGFLYNMVRCLAGTLCDIGRGKREVDALPAVIDGRDRRLAGPNLPARGLTLVAVHYDGYPTRERPPANEADSA